MKGRFFLFLCVFFMMFSVLLSGRDNLSHAALTKQLSYQGRLQDATGQPVANGTYSVTFSIYNVLTGGSPLYTETQNVTVDKGGFSAYIGSVTPLNLLFNEDYFLGIKVGSDPEMTPRLKLAIVGTSAFALDAGNAANFGGQPPTAFAPSAHNHDSSYSPTTHTHTPTGVTQIVAGSNVTVSPIGGTGVVTINATGGGGGSALTPAASVTSVGASSVVGTSTNFAREDHAHNIPAALITDAEINASAAIAKSKLNLSNSILFSDIAQNGCASGQVVEWNGSAWVCGTDDTTGGGAVVNNPGATQTIIAGNSTTTPIIAKGAAGTSVPMFEVQDSAGAQKLAVMPDGHVYIPSTNQLHVLNVNNDSPTGPMGDITIDVNGTGNTKLILTNSNASRVADLTVEGAVLVGNPTQTLPKLSVEDSSANPAIAVKHTGTGTAVDAWNSGTAGSAVVASITNASNASDLIAGDTSGTGNLLKLSLSGMNKFVVNNAGRINTASVDTGSIIDSTILFADVAANGCAGGQVFEYNGSAWVCGTDDGAGSVITGPTSTQTIIAGNSTTTPLIVKAAATPSVAIFDVQDSSATSRLTVNSSGQVVATSAGNITLNASGAVPTTVQVTNSDVSFTANLSVEGNVLVDGTQLKKSTAGVLAVATTSGGIQLDAFNAGAVTNVQIVNSDMTNVANLDLEGDLTRNGTGTFTVKNSTGNVTIDAASAVPTTVQVTNSDVTFTANLSVEGNVLVDGTQLKKSTAGVLAVATTSGGIQLDAFNGAGATNVQIVNTDATQVANIDLEGNLTRNGTGTFTVKNSTGNVTIDAASAVPTTVQVINNDATFTANLSVEGNVLVDGSQLKKSTAGVLAVSTTSGGIQLDAFNAGAVTNVQVVNTDATQVANIDLEGDLIRNGTGTFTIKNSTGAVTIDAFAVAPTLVSVQNSDAGFVADLAVEGNVLISPSNFKAVASPAASLQKIQSGRNCETLATDGFITVTFPTAYTAAPIVTGTLDKNATATTSTTTFFNAATDVTSTTVTFRGLETTTYIECVQWIAVGN